MTGSTVVMMLNILAMLYMFLCLTTISVHGFSFEKDEPQCLSRFDYDYKVLQKLVASENQQTELREEISKLQNELNELKQSQKDKDVAAFNFALGSTFVRWGRITCPDNGTELVYEGYAGGSCYMHSGAASNYLCLPKEPLWGHFNDAKQKGAQVHGGEYQFNDWNRKSFFGREIFQNDAPCAVCRSTRASVLMIPGRNACYDGWTLEYWGYLAAGHTDHKAASEFVCVDEKPEIVVGGEADQNGNLFYFAEARCGSLKCPPYVDGRELTCAVCTK